MKSLKSFPRKKITLIELQDYLKIDGYEKLCDSVQQLIEVGTLEPIKNSGFNGKKPLMYQAYRIIHQSRDYSELRDELLFMSTELSNDYYLSHLDIYEKDREFVLRMERYLKEQKDSLLTPMSNNERSFEIFFREKFLTKEGGMRILKNLGWVPESLNMYETSEPLAYYSHTKNVGQTMLIIENKDTFYSMRRHLMNAGDTIFGEKIGTLIYGGGKAIYKRFLDFNQCVEPYMRDNRNKLLYFGDLDYEGILIFEQLAKIARDQFEIQPFVRAYEAMLNKSSSIILPMTKEAQNRTGGREFMPYFTKDLQIKMQAILDSEQYIPQEILHCGDF